MTIGQLKRALANWKDEESIVFFGNGYAQPVITTCYDDNYGAYLSISHEGEVKPNPKDILCEDSQFVEEMKSIRALEKFFKSK